MSGDLHEMHRLLTLLQAIDVGLVIVGRDYRITLWNSFMENHSGRTADRVLGKSLFELALEVPEDWLKQKLDTTFALENRTCTTWEQRPYLFRYKSYRPITGMTEHMYQDVSFLPLRGLTGEVEHIGIVLYDVTDVAEHKLKLEAANRRLEAVSRLDSLTGLFNRGYWDECLRQEFARYRRMPRDSSLVLFDVDHFKAINDEHGHTAGDEVLRQLGRLLNETLRSTDIVGRYGGEEFAIILPDTAAANARIMAEHLRQNVSALQIPHEPAPLRITVSIGIAAITDDMPDAKTWVMLADQALYRAKADGRDRIAVFSDTDD
jgi:diguanylate cyclase (GGDEF)-like protein/PAS domain S-box-containing protein